MIIRLIMVESNDILFAAIILFSGIAVGFLVWTLFQRGGAQKQVRQSAEGNSAPAEFGSLRRARAVDVGGKPIKTALLRLAEVLGKQQKEGNLRREFTVLYAQAGWPKNMSDNQLLGVVYLLGICISLLYAVALVRVSPVLLFGAPVIGFSMSYLVVKQWLKGRIQTRYSLVAKMLPYVMDILSMTMNAGASLQSAIELIVLNYGSHPIGEEFDAVMYDVERGASMVEAFSGFRERLREVPIVQSFADEIINALRFGRPLASLLANSSAKYKKYRIMTAQDKAGRARVLILVPGFIILIGGLIILFGPFIIKFLNDSGQLGMTF